MVKRILRLEGSDAETTELMLAAFRDYRARARPRPRLDGESIRRMIELLLRHGDAEEVAPLVNAGLKRAQQFPGIEACAMRLAHKLQRAGERNRARGLYTEVMRRFPGTPSARDAERALTRVNP